MKRQEPEPEPEPETRFGRHYGDRSERATEPDRVPEPEAAAEPARVAEAGEPSLPPPPPPTAKLFVKTNEQTLNASADERAATIAVLKSKADPSNVMDYDVALGRVLKAAQDANGTAFACFLVPGAPPAEAAVPVTAGASEASTKGDSKALVAEFETWLKATGWVSA